MDVLEAFMMMTMMVMIGMMVGMIMVVLWIYTRITRVLERIHIFLGKHGS